jgi:hypothetical protein
MTSTRAFSEAICLSRCVSYLTADLKLSPYQAYKHIFTSPTSVTIEEENIEPARHRAKRPNNGIASKKSSVASLLNMHSVTPRSIAYIAVQVCYFVFTSSFLTHISFRSVSLCPT